MALLMLFSFYCLNNTVVYVLRYELPSEGQFHVIGPQWCWPFKIRKQNLDWKGFISEVISSSTHRQRRPMKCLNQYLSSHVDEDFMAFIIAVVHLDSKMFLFCLLDLRSCMKSFKPRHCPFAFRIKSSLLPPTLSTSKWSLPLQRKSHYFQSRTKQNYLGSFHIPCNQCPLPSLYRFPLPWNINLHLSLS